MADLSLALEKTNEAKLNILLIVGGTTVLRNEFDKHHPPANLAGDLNACYSILNDLLRRQFLNNDHWNKLFPPGGTPPDSNTFDITLLFVLLTNICGLSPPPTGWHKKPTLSDTSLEANIVRIKFFRNLLYWYVGTTGVDTPSFNAMWVDISAALGLRQGEINRLKAERFGDEDILEVLTTTLESSIEDVRQAVTEIRQSLLHTDQGDEILRYVTDYAARYLQGTRESFFA